MNAQGHRQEQRQAPRYRLRATTKSDNALLDNKELIFGKIDPGQTQDRDRAARLVRRRGPQARHVEPRSSTNAPRICTIPKDSVTRSDGIKVKFDASGGHAPADAELRTTIHGARAPGLRVHLPDRRQPQRQRRRARAARRSAHHVPDREERRQGPLATRRRPTSATSRATASCSHDGRFDISNMMPGDVRKVAFTFDVEQQLADNEAKVELSVGDRDLREVASEKIKIPIEPARRSSLPRAASCSAGPQGAAASSTSRRRSARSFGKRRPGTQRLRDWPGRRLRQGRPRRRPLRVRLGQRRRARAGVAGSAAVVRRPLQPRSAHASTWRRQLSPPATATSRSAPPRPTAPSCSTPTSSSVRARCSTSATPRRRSQEDERSKPTSRFAPGSTSSRSSRASRLIPMSRKTIVVRRDGPNGELLPTPTTEDSLWETKEGGDEELP